MSHESLYPQADAPSAVGQAIAPEISPAPPGGVSCFAGGGKAGEILQAIDWTQRPVGPVEQWPHSLRTALSICLLSRYPICILWGPERTYLYNDAYTPIVGDKHPWALGELYPRVWPEIWDTIKPILEEVESTGQASWGDNILLVLRRYGFNEECYFAFSFAPILAEDGTVGGVFTAITETTRQLVGERRLRTLKDLGARAPDAKSAEEACRLAIEVLAANRHDVPFALFYVMEADGRARFVGGLGTENIPALCPAHIPLSTEDDAAGPWPFGEVARTGRPVVLRDLTRRFGPLPGGPWEEPAHTAVVAPIARPGQAMPYGFFVAGVSPRRSLDADYESFLTLVASQVATAISNAQAYEEERKRAEALAELDRAKTAFFTNVSHEFRTPLTLMLGPLEEVLNKTENGLAPGDREQLQLTHRNSIRLLKLANTLLDFSRIEAGRVRASFEPTDLAAATSELASVFRSAIEKAGMRLFVNCEKISQPVHVDRDMWEKIVLNLLSNAFKFTFEGEIEVALREGAGMAELTVRDTGTGIPREELENIFKRFHRVEGARGRTFEGTGIGLALVQELVKLHGGAIAVSSEPGRGSAFTVRLPLGAGHLPRQQICAPRAAASTALRAEVFLEEALRWLPDHPAPSQPVVAGEASSLDNTLNEGHREETKSGRILLADDNADMRDYIRRLLGHHYEVTAVADGEAALREIEQRRPDLVLTDVMMPRCDGFQLLQALRANPATRGIPVLMLSARAGEESRIEGLQAGADDYLIKPFSARELLARVQTRLELARLRAEAARDIAEASQHLRISEERFRLVSRATNDVIWDWDLATGRALWNEAVHARLGYAPEEMGATAELWYERIHPEDRERVVHGVHAAIDGGAETWQAEYRFLCKDGAYRVFFDRGFIARHGDGNAYRMIGSMQDVTEKKRAEQRLEAAVVERTARLRETIAELEAFSYSISHDMRGPLRAMQGYARALLEDAGSKLNSAEHEYLSRIARAAQRLDRLIRDVLDYSRLAKTRVVLEPIDVEKLIHEIVQQYPALQSPEVRVDIQKPLHTVLGHEVLLTQCLSNLLGNAVKFVVPGTSPRVRVRTEPCGEDVRLWVEDSGIGIAPHNHNRVFGIFQRINPDAAYEGTGIGLAIVRKAAERMGGEVGVESELGAGSRFWIRLRTAGA